MEKDKKVKMVFLDDFHATQGNTLICNKGEYGTHPINSASALEFCPICKELMPLGKSNKLPKRDVSVKKAADEHVINRESIYCPSEGRDIRVGMGSALEICPACRVFL